jgi:hypothetical protein
VPLDIPRFTVAVARDGYLDLDDALEAGPGVGYDVHAVAIMHADMLVAEQAGPRYGLGELKADKLAYSTLWCWAALRRKRIEVVEFPIFKARVLSIEEDKAAGSDGAPPAPEESADPTRLVAVTTSP